MKNVLERVPGPLPEELVELLAAGTEFRLERIVSEGHCSPEGFWYDQLEQEWVLVLKGEAILQFEDERSQTHLRAGDAILIPARRRHRVEWTIPGEQTVWLAIFFMQSEKKPDDD